MPHITHIINACINNSYFPKSWKFAHVLPLPKISNPSDYGHLRSISILPTLSKILEKVMERQINSYILAHNIIPEKQSGFRNGFSCSTALSDILDDVMTARDKSEAAILVLLDYTKAFDMIHHEILIAILKYIGFTNNSSSLVASFLTDRAQRVVLGGQESQSHNITTGVPQGSILGPLLYSIFTSNFVKYLKYSKYHLYADDTQIYLSFRPDEVAMANAQINHDLNRILNVSNDHLLKINPNKSTALLFCSETIREALLNTISLKIGSDIISFKECTKNLGLIIDSKLKFKEHVTLSLKRGFSMLKMIYSHRHYLSQKTKTELCDSLVLSHCNFADNVYGPFLDAVDTRRIQKLQNSCIRLICGIRRRRGVSYKLRELGWLNMFNRRALHSICLYYKIIKFKVPPYLYNKLKFRTDVHNLNIRRKNLLTIPSHNKEMFKKSFSYNVANLINKYEIMDFSLSVASFKKKLK